MPLLTIQELAKNRLEDEAKLPLMVEKYIKTVDYDAVADNLININEAVGINELLSNNIDESKRRFFNCGWLSIYRVNRFNNRFLDFGLDKIAYPLLSDSDELILRFSKLKYQRGSNSELNMDAMVAGGDMPIWCNTIQMFMVNDLVAIERNLNIIETMTLKRLSKREELMVIDFEFFKALYNNNRNKCEEILDMLVSPKIHNRRNDNQVLSKHISHPAIGYAKLAWRMGIQVEVSSKLVPKEILPIKPLKIYLMPYDFLQKD